MIEVIVKTNSKKDSILKTGEDSYKIETKARAKDMEANLKVIEILSEYLKIPKTRLFIKSGLRYKKKLIEIK